jgi:AraC-like DNA-binding protein
MSSGDCKILFVGFSTEEAIEILQTEDAEIYTIEGVAKIVGFNSKSSFNGAFKKSTGFTPSEFKNQK